MAIRALIEAMRVPPEHAESFLEEASGQRLAGLWILGILGVVLFLLFIGLDYLLYPSEFLILTQIRLAVVALGLTLLLFVRRVHLRQELPRYSSLLIWSFVGIYTAGLDAVLVIVGGLGTPYYAGFSVLMVVLATALPLRPARLLGVLVALVIQANLVSWFFQSDGNTDAVIGANYYLVASLLVGFLIGVSAHYLRVHQFSMRIALADARKRSDLIARNAMPDEVARELIQTGRYQARHIPSCTVLFSDFVGFTRLASRVSPSELVHGLDQAFSHFDDIATRHGLERIKTMGDSYMACAGVLEDGSDHFVRTILAGLEMLEAVGREGLRGPDGTPWRMRLGIHSGPAVAGVVGSKNYAFDLWGDAVNVASRLESLAQPDTINMTTEMYETVEEFMLADDRGIIPVRGKGPIAMSQLHRLRPRYSFDESGRLPNAHFYAELEQFNLEQGLVTDHPSVVEPEPPDVSVSMNEFDPINAFTMLIPEDQERLRELAQEVPISEGDVLFREGQDLSVLYLVIRGLFGVRIKKERTDIEVAVLGSGELLGELSFVSLEPASATVVALADSAVLRFDLNRLQQMHSEYPGFSARLFHSFALRLARRVRISNARLFSLGVEKKQHDSIGQGAVTSPHIPTEVVGAVAQLQQHLRPYLDGSKPEESLPDGIVGKVCDRLVKALGRHQSKDTDEIRTLGTVIQREAYRFLMRSKLFQLIQGAGVLSHPVMEAIVENRLLSNNAVGAQFEKWFLNQPLAVAIRESSAFMGDHVEESYLSDAPTWRVTSLARGPAQELFSFVDRMGSPINLRLTYVDDQIESLAAAGQLASELSMEDRVSLVRLNVLVRGMIRTRLRLVPQDLIFYQTMIQEISEDALLDLLDEVYSLLAPGGRFLLGRLHLPNEHYLFLEHVLELPFATWDTDTLLNLVQRSAFGERFSWLSEDANSFFSFLEVYRPH